MESTYGHQITHLQEHYLAIRPLSIGGVCEGIKDLLQGDNLSGPPIHTLPHYAIRLQRQ